MVGMDMSLPMQATEHTSPIHALGSHLAMYIGLTGSTQTMVLDFAMLILFVCAIYVIAQVFLRVLSVNTQHHISRKTVWRILRAIAQHNELRWLSLSLISPPRVYALA